MSVNAADGDGDGVSDADDRCEGYDDNVDVDGDGVADGCDDLIDLDGDGVSDGVDMCPTTPVDWIEMVDENGCWEPPAEPVGGCMDELASNFDSNAEGDDGSCEYTANVTEELDNSSSSEGGLSWVRVGVFTPILFVGLGWFLARKLRQNR